MKKTLIYLSIAAAFAASCSHSEIDSPKTPEGWGGKKAAISLGVKSADSPLTKAEATRPGDDDGEYNENKVYTLDYFVYNVDPSASGNTSTAAITSGRLSYEEGIEPTTDETAKANTQVVPLDEFTDYFGDGKTNKCYVYVLANLPSEFTMGEDGKLVYKNADETTTTIETNWDALQAVELVTNFKGTLTEDNKFKAQDSFVMTGLTGELTLSGNGPDEVIVDLKRIATKLTLDINVIKMIDKYEYNTILNHYTCEGTYFPNVEKMQIYLTYVNPGTNFNGDSRKYDNTFFTYNRYAYTPNVDPEGTYTSKVIDKNEDGTIQIDDEGNAIYVDGPSYPAFNVTGTPFYSYPTNWTSTDTHAPFIKIIIPWVKYDVHEKIREAYSTMDDKGNVTYDTSDETYLALIEAVKTFPESTTMTVNKESYPVTRKTTEWAMTNRNGDEFYYKISIPAFKANSTTDCELVRNNWYNINLDISVLGSESDDAAIIIHGSKMGIYVLDWSKPNDDLGGDIDGGRYLSTALDEYTINAVNSITIPVISSHIISARITSAQRKRNGSWENVSRGEVQTSGTSSLTLTNTLNNTVGSSLDCFPFKFEIEITQVNSDGTSTGTLTETVTVYQYPSIYIDSKAGGNVMIDGFYGNVDNHYHSNGTGNTPYGNSGTNTSTTTQTPYAPISNYVDRQQSMTIISISSLGANDTYTIPGSAGGTFDYLITDPRQASGFSSSDLDAHYRGEYNQTNANSRLIAWTEAEASGVKVGNTSHRNYIAPKIMISSRWGRMGNWNPPGTQAARFETVQKRCATYQEAGYPAGRWRLPTEAEIMFIANLQRYQLINELFTSSGPSISASGGVFTVSTSGVSYAAPGNNDGGRSCRCVYDLWYWGEDPVEGAQSTYTIAVE